MNSLSCRARQGRWVMTVGMVVNIFLALAKILGGWLGRSHALIADGIESSLDILSSSLMWGALKYSERPPDRDHPYGHGKMESLAAMLGSIFVIFAGFSLGFHSVGEIIRFHTEPTSGHTPAAYTLVILGVTIVTKEGLFRWLRHQGGRIGSRAVETDALHHRSDALTSLAAGVGIAVALWGGPRWAAADDWAALFSCLLISWNGFRMLRGALGDLLDEQVSREKTEKILVTARSVPGVRSVEKCRVRRSGLSAIADLHVRVPGEYSVREGHRISHQVKDRLMQEEFHLSDVTVHIEPD